MAIAISAEEVLSWTDEALEILKEKIPRVADESELVHIDYGEIINAVNDYREFNIDDFIQSVRIILLYCLKDEEFKWHCKDEEFILMHLVEKGINELFETHEGEYQQYQYNFRYISGYIKIKSN